MPTKVELDDYLQRAESVPRPDVDDASTTCTGSPAAVNSGRSCAFSPSTIANSWPIWRGRPGATSLHSAAQAAVVGRSRSGGAGAGLDQRSGILADGTYGQRCAQRHYRQGLVDRPPYRTASSRPLRLGMATSARS